MNGPARTSRLQRSRLGQLFFSIMSHRLYDTGLYRFVTGSIWRCPTDRLLDGYADNVTHNHLEVGVGSGYFLDRTLCADAMRRLVLVDLNRRCLAKSAARLKLYDPDTLQHDIRQPLPGNLPGFASVGMNYVLHCIPGSFAGNHRIFRNVHSALEEGGVFFGATLLPQEAHDGIAAWLFMRLLNRVGIFSNNQHCLEELQGSLKSLFSEVEVSVVGCAILFRAVK